MKMIIYLQRLTDKLKVIKNLNNKLSKDDTTYVDGEKIKRVKFPVVLELHTSNTYSHSECYCMLFLLHSFHDKEESKAINLSLNYLKFADAAVLYTANRN